MPIANRADRFTVLRGLLAPVVFSVPFWWPTTGLAALLLPLAMFVLIGETNYLLHLHIHRPLSTRRWLNLTLDLCMAVATGMTASNWRIQHRYGHHERKDIPYRVGAEWETARYTPRGALSFSIRSIWPTFWRPIVESWRRGVLANETTPIGYRWAFVEQVGLILLVAALAAWQPWVVLTFVLPWCGTIYFITRYVDYLNHVGCDETGPAPYARANNCLHPLFNRFTHNFGYHTAHHLRPTAHWTELPGIQAAIAHRIPPSCLKSYSWSWVLLPWHCVQSLRGRM